VTVTNNGAYTRYVYGATYALSYTTIKSTTEEAFSAQIFDGAGRPFYVYGDHPGSVNGYAAVRSVYDVMGRLFKRSNPTEIGGNGIPAGEDQGDWVYTTQTYDWKGRPLRTIHPDGYYTELSYDGCGCAGGEVVTAIDETGRARRTTSDVLGRMVKSEELNWPDANGFRSPYSTANYVYNALDQVKTITHEGQERLFEYDGYGRLKTRTTPEQGITTYAYNADDTLLSVTDARQVITSYLYNNRHLPTNINYTVSGIVAATPNVSFGYDAAGNRTSMTDGLGTATYHYDSLSRMDWEERTLSGFGPYRLSYSYNLANELTGIDNPFGSHVGYGYDTNGRVNSVTGSGSVSVSNYSSGITYRAFGAVKAMSFGDGRSLSTGYDNRLRPTSWNVSGLLGYNYSYLERTDKVNYARNVYDATLDRSYEYDQVGALVVAHSGAEARAAFGIDGQGWGQKDGPYSHRYDYDKYGNMTLRYGWGGEVQGGDANNEPPPIEYHYTNNKLNDFLYDAAGNMVYDGNARQYKYDANGQQVDTPFSIMPLQQAYDGDALRVRKTENLYTTYYLRSTVLGGKIVAEIDANGNWTRGYVYQGEELLATQSGGQVNWTHTDPVTKSQRVTDINGSVIQNGVVELDPWGAGTSRNSGGAPFQPQNFAGYTRDGDGQQDAMARRYSVTGRFSQPDPYSGSYDLSDPQSLNRYIYTKNDPVNRRDPSGLVSLEDGLDPTKVHGMGMIGALYDGGIFVQMWTIPREGPPIFSGWFWAAFPGTQNSLSAKEATAAVRKAVNSLLKKKQCKKFLNSMLSALSTANGIASVGNSFSDVFKARSKSVGFTDDTGLYDDYGQTNLIGGQLHIGVNFSRATPTGPNSLGMTAIHETFHAAASQGLYSEIDMANAAFDVGKKMGLIPDLVSGPMKGESKEAQAYNTKLTDSTIFAACGGQ
jgi:RHS repeat-associated protein